MSLNFESVIDDIFDQMRFSVLVESFDLESGRDDNDLDVVRSAHTLYLVTYKYEVDDKSDFVYELVDDSKYGLRMDELHSISGVDIGSIRMIHLSPVTSKWVLDMHGDMVDKRISHELWDEIVKFNLSVSKAYEYGESSGVNKPEVDQELVKQIKSDNSDIVGKMNSGSASAFISYEVKVREYLDEFKKLNLKFDRIYDSYLAKYGEISGKGISESDQRKLFFNYQDFNERCDGVKRVAGDISSVMASINSIKKYLAGEAKEFDAYVGVQGGFKVKRFHKDNISSASKVIDYLGDTVNKLIRSVNSFSNRIDGLYSSFIPQISRFDVRSAVERKKTEKKVSVNYAFNNYVSWLANTKYIPVGLGKSFEYVKEFISSKSDDFNEKPGDKEGILLVARGIRPAYITEKDPASYALFKQHTDMITSALIPSGYGGGAIVVHNRSPKAKHVGKTRQVYPGAVNLAKTLLWLEMVGSRILHPAIYRFTSLMLLGASKRYAVIEANKLLGKIMSGFVHVPETRRLADRWRRFYKAYRPWTIPNVASYIYQPDEFRQEVDKGAGIELDDEKEEVFEEAREPIFESVYHVKAFAFSLGYFDDQVRKLDRMLTD